MKFGGFLVVLLAVLVAVNADCGCLKCCKDCQVISPPSCPLKVIMKGNTECNCPQAIPFSVQTPVIPPPLPLPLLKDVEYKTQFPVACQQIVEPLRVYEFGVQTPVIPPVPAPVLLGSLTARADRLVIPAPKGCVCPQLTDGVAPTDASLIPGCSKCMMWGSPAYPPVAPVAAPVAPVAPFPLFDTLTVPPTLAPQPFFEAYMTPEPTCGCSRYETSNRCKRDIDDKSHARCKRDIPILRHIPNFVLGLLPTFLKFPIQQTINGMKIAQNKAKINNKINKNKINQKKLIKNSNNLLGNSRSKAIGSKNNVDNSFLNLFQISERSGNFDSSILPLDLQKKLVQNLSTLKSKLPKNDNKIAQNQKLLKEFENLRDVTEKISKNLDQNLPKPVQSLRLNRDFNKLNEMSEKLIETLINEEQIAKTNSKKIFSLSHLLPENQKLVQLSQQFADSLSTTHNEPKYSAATYKKPMSLKSKAILMDKLKKLNENDEHSRRKRSIIVGGENLNLPFFEVKEEDDVNDYLKELLSRNQEEGEEEEDDVSEEEEDEETVGARRRMKYIAKKQNEYAKPLSFNHIIPHNPIFYFLNAPLRLLRHFHGFRKQVNPILKSVPEVIVSSRHYVKDFGKNLKTNVLDFASNLIGDFDHMNPTQNLFGNHGRFRRDVSQNQNKNLTDDGENLKRRKRYILKVVDEDEVQEYLREKLGGLMGSDGKKVESKKSKAKKSKTDVDLSILAKAAEKHTNKKVVVQPLQPKIIIDNHGIPFSEINGNKRPILFRKKSSDSIEDVKNFDTSEEGNTEINGKIDDLIEMAKQKIDNGEPLLQSKNIEMPIHIIKDKISEILTEVDNLMNTKFDQFSEIYDELLVVQNIKTSVTADWKEILINKKFNDINSKIRILDNIRNLQQAKDILVKNVANALKSSTSSFVTKKLIKILIRLQKLQCLIHRVVEDFENTLRIGTQFDIEKEIKLVDFMSELNFVTRKTRFDVVNDLKKEKEAELEKLVELLESLRQLIENHEFVNNDKISQKINDEAKILWEIKNIEKLQKDTIQEMNDRIENDLKIKKELKILFDLLKQIEVCENKQEALLGKNKIVVNNKNNVVGNSNRSNLQKMRLDMLKKYPSLRSRSNFSSNKGIVRKT